jgi:SpoVK/Ycf46/Vps4 family AAA+-type ATPase
MIWHKYVTPSGEYYSPFGKSKTTVEAFERASHMADALNRKDTSFNIITSELVEIYDSSTPSSPPIDLPAGVYSHERGNGAAPERLVPMVLRDDKYIDLLDDLDDLGDTVEDFKQNRSLYDETNSIYKLGVLLFGPPGTGKTSYMRKFIKQQKEAVVIFLDDVPSRKFLEKLEESTKDQLKIIVFEEVVSLVSHQEAIREMLDFLDGSKTVSNAIYFMSTNYPEDIPQNVIRNGRVDLFVRVGFPDKKGANKLVNLYLKRDATDTELSSVKDKPIVDIREICFMHRKTNKSFEDCVKIVEEKNKLLVKHFGKSVAIKLT